MKTKILGVSTPSFSWNTNRWSSLQDDATKLRVVRDIVREEEKERCPQAIEASTLINDKKCQKPI
jgi:hypothetical protein